MTKSLLYSLGVHIMILGLIIIIGDRPVEIVGETVFLRLREQSAATREWTGGNALVPGVSRKKSGTIGLPRFEVEDNNTSPRELKAFERVISFDLPVAMPDLPEVAALLDHNLPVDPLEGMEEFLFEEADTDYDLTRTWSLSWTDGRNRGVLSHPRLDALPEHVERVIDVTVAIQVSPQGDVVSADITPPGSGDVRIDRLLHGAALSFIFEPWPSDEGYQTALLRLVFQGDAS